MITDELKEIISRKEKRASPIFFAKAKNLNLEIRTFPSFMTFLRRLRKEVPEQAIYLARYGQAAWNKKYASYVARDYSNISRRFAQTM